MSQYQLLRSLTTGEYDQLKESIRAHGVKVPVEYDETGKILDGHHRVKICQELGIADWPRIVRFGMSEVEKAAHILALNAARRHLTLDDLAEMRKRRIDLETQLRGEGQSLRAIADRAGVSHIQVRNDLGVSASGVNQLTPELVTGKDGKAYPARKNAIVLFNPSRQVVAKAKQVVEAAEAEPERFGSLVAEMDRTGKIGGAYRKLKRARDAEALATVQPPTGKFRTIVIDPPWHWGDEGDVSQMGRSRPTYATIPIAELHELPVPDLATDDCHIYLWITNRSLPKGFALLETWDFRYITTLTWAKPSIGIGNYFRNNTEHILFGVKGKLALLEHDQGTWFTAPRGSQHSSKPDEAYRIIARCSPGPRLNMFSRQEREGFTLWGNP